VLEITATATDRFKTLQGISHALARAWQYVAYLDLQAASIVRYRQGTVMRFITASHRGLCVTGHVTITAPHYDQMVASFERDFSFAGPLMPFPSVPFVSEQHQDMP
jgi:hypothetical protein